MNRLQALKKRLKKVKPVCKWCGYSYGKKSHSICKKVLKKFSTV